MLLKMKIRVTSFLLKKEAYLPELLQESRLSISWKSDKESKICYSVRKRVTVHSSEQLRKRIGKRG